MVDLTGTSRLSGTTLAGGSPWRLVRLSEHARTVVDRWLAGERLEASQRMLARALVDRGLARPRWSPDWDRGAIEVVVPVRDDVAHLATLLGQLADFSVTVVDDGSSDPAPVARCAEAAGARLVRLATSRGPGAARNAGALASTRPWLWFIDVDVVLDDAPALAARLLASGHDPAVGAIAPRLRGVGDARRGRFERAHGPLDLGPAGGLVAPGTLRSYVPSACLLVRREALAEGFDEALPVGEDVDLVWRLVDAGWLVRYDADLVIGHLTRPTWRAWWRQRVGYGTSAAPLARRHGARLAPVVVDGSTASVLVGLLTGQAALVAAATALLGSRINAKLTRDLEHRGALVARLVGRALAGGVGGSARAVVRTYGPLLGVGALVPRLRRRVWLIVALGTLWRWRARGGVTARDVPLAMADDLAYGVGVWLGAWRARDATALRPLITGPEG